MAEKTQEKKSYLIRLEAETAERVREAAKADGRTVASWLRKAVSEKLERDRT